MIGLEPDNSAASVDEITGRQGRPAEGRFRTALSYIGPRGKSIEEGRGASKSPQTRPGCDPLVLQR